MGGPHAPDHANVVLVDAYQRLEQGNAMPRICLPQGSARCPLFERGVVNGLGRANLSAAQNGPAISAELGVANHSAAAPVICRAR
jgi:hypothetical protein